MKSEFDKEWAAKLGESDKGSFYQQEKWLEELDIQKSKNVAVSESASCSKIQLEEPDEESQLSSSTPSADGTWKTISGRAIVSTETGRVCILSILPGKSPSHGKCSDQAWTWFYQENPVRE